MQSHPDSRRQDVENDESPFSRSTLRMLCRVVLLAIVVIPVLCILLQMLEWALMVGWFVER